MRILLGLETIIHVAEKLRIERIGKTGIIGCGNKKTLRLKKIKWVLLRSDFLPRTNFGIQD